MLGLLNSAVLKLRLYLMKRRPFDNLALRQLFRERYDIDVGMYSYGCFDQWRMPGPIRIGRYCSFASTVRSAPISHPLEALTTHPALHEKKFGVVDSDITWDEPLIVEYDVWVAHNVVILPSCKFIGRGAVIGAGAILTKNVDRYAVMVAIRRARSAIGSNPNWRRPSRRAGGGSSTLPNCGGSCRAMATWSTIRASQRSKPGAETGASAASGLEGPQQAHHFSDRFAFAQRRPGGEARQQHRK